MRDCQDIGGVLPLIDAHLPETPTEADPAWFVAALATPLDDLDDRMTFDQAVAVCLSLAMTLEAMHAKGYSHRDIKPGNIFRLGDHWCLGDFGLADFPEKIPLTRRGERLGPQYYLAPEMLHSAETADGRKADVYSLGKLLWKLTTGHNYPLPGVHFRIVPALTISANVAADNSVALDALLEAMTQFEVAQRPAMADVARELAAWTAPSPRPVRPTDLGPFAKRAQGLVDVYIEGRRRRSALQATADQARDRAFAAVTPAIDTMKAELERAKIGAVHVQQPTGGNAAIYHAVTGDTAAGVSDRTSMFHYSVTTRIDAGDYRGALISGVEIGIRNVEADSDTLHDIYAPVVGAAGHIVIAEDLFGGSWRSSSKLIWGDQDRFVLDQPRQNEVLGRFASGLTASLAAAVEAMLASLEAMKQPRALLQKFNVRIGDQIFALVVSEQRHLDGIAAARSRSHVPHDTDEAYVQFVLSDWAKTQDSPPTQQALQATLDRAVESYCRELLDRE